MSIRTWKDEYYPDVVDENNRFPDWNAAIDSAILKWSGLLPDILLHHEIYQDTFHGKVLKDGWETFDVDCTSCGLCKLSKDDCEECPITAVTKGRTCFEDIECDPDLSNDIGALSEYARFTEHGDPIPMIKLLDKTKEFMQTHHFDENTRKWVPNDTTE